MSIFRPGWRRRPFLPCNRAFFQYTAGRYGLEKAYLLTNGPFTLAAWNHGESLLLRRHEQYHAAQDILPQAVRYVIGTADPVEALNTGTMDAELLPADRLQEAAAAGIRLVGLRDTVRSVYFNTRDTALSNADVRRALRDSVEWESIYAYLEELGEQPAAGYIAPDATVNGSELYRSDANDARLQTRAAQGAGKPWRRAAGIVSGGEKPGAADAACAGCRWGTECQSGAVSYTILAEKPEFVLSAGACQ